MILILPFESAGEEVSHLSEALPLSNRVLPVKKDLQNMYHKERDQYESSGYVKRCHELGQEKERIVLGVTGIDLFSEGLNFVFGTARIGGWGCVISISRLGDVSERTFEERVVKEAVHEIGHTVGLTHCSKPICVMHFSNSLADTDRKSGWFCDDCVDGFEGLLRKRGLSFDD